MMKEAALPLKRLKALVRECRIHSRRMMRAYQISAALFPLSAGKYAALTDEDVEHIDQLIYRFSKLQDAMGERLFPTVLEYLGEEGRRLPFLDALNRLEALGVIKSAEAWLVLRRIRNEVAQDYSDEAEESCSYLNGFREQVTTLLDAFQGVADYLATRDADIVA
jgi:hypothetical protein